MQDLFQPMHLFGPYKGGNNWDVIIYRKGHKRNISMHSLWDNYIPNYFIKTNDTIFTANANKAFEDMNDYNNYLQDEIKELNEITCNVTSDVNGTIYFDNYYNPYTIAKLIQGHLIFALNTLQFIFN